MHYLYRSFLIISLVLTMSGCGGSGSSSDAVIPPDDTLSTGGAATASPGGTGGEGSQLNVTASQNVTIGGSAVPTFTPPQTPVPPSSGAVVLGEDYGYTELPYLYAGALWDTGTFTLTVNGNLIVPANLTLLADFANAKLVVNGDLVVNGSLTSELPGGQLTALDVNVSGNAYLSGEVDNSGPVDGANGSPILIRASNIYAQGIISASGNDGIATSGGIGQSITLQATTSIHLSGATIETGGGSALAVGLGGNGGPITLIAPAIYADITSSLFSGGGDGVAGTGNCGTVSLMASSLLSFGGTIDCPGGNGLSALPNGGTGGTVTLDSSELQIGGSISVDGGNGESIGGNGGSVTFKYSAASVISPEISLDGGTATGTTGATFGGSGGTINISQTTSIGTLNLFTAPFDLGLSGGNGGAYGGNGGGITIQCSANLVMNGDVSIDGGQGATNGGSAGFVLIYSSVLQALNGYMSLNGGQGGTNGGNGGVVSINSSVLQALNGYMSFNGGQGAIGGTGGSLSCFADNGFTSALSAELNGGTSTGGTGSQGGTVSFQNGSATAPLSFSGLLTSVGGHGSTNGGSGGNITISSPGTLTISGSLIVTGGQTSGTTCGNGGFVTILGTGSSGIVNNATTIDARGGDGEGTSLANGGNGGIIRILSYNSSITTNGTVTASGGSSYRQVGGNGGVIQITSDSNTNGSAGAGSGGDVTNGGSVICDGGLGLTGGTGGTILFGTSPNDSSTSGLGSNSRFISSSGGGGNNNDGMGGTPGFVTCNGTGTFVNTGTILANYGNFSPGPPANVIIN
jgi:hypothetical protein